MSRKLLSLLVAVVFVLMSVSTGFAAAIPADVAGTDFVKAVSKMQGLGIMVGDPNGNFRPNDTIKRSEFAKIAVIASGLSDAAAISTGTTQFSDVPADHWATGYINVAAGAKLIVGSAGKFRPDDTITYGEAITIICRMLGYGPVLDPLSGWPNQYIAKGAEIGVTDGVTSVPTLGATRGNVAKLINNSLTIQPLIVAGYNEENKPTYKISKAGAIAAGGDGAQTILEKNLKFTQVTNAADDNKVVVMGTPSLQNATDVQATTLTNGTPATLKFVDSINPDDYLGLKVKAWYKSYDGTNKVGVVEVQSTASDYYDGIIQKDDTKVKLVGLGKSYDFANTFDAYINSSASGSQANFVGALGNNYATARVVFDNGKISKIFAWADTKGDAANTAAFRVPNTTTFRVNEIKDGYLKTKSTSVGANNLAEPANDLKIQTFKDNIATKDVWLDIVKDGKAATIDDIAAGDVVTKINVGDTTVQNYTGHQKWIVSSASVDGTLTAVSGTGADMTLTVGGKDYKLAMPHSFSFNNGDDYNKDFNNVKDIIGKSLTLKLNAVGQIRYAISNTGGSTYYYGIVRSTNTGVGINASDTSVTMYKADGTKTTYVLEDPDNVANAAAVGQIAANRGAIAQYQLTSDGKIKNDSLYIGNAINNFKDKAYANNGGTNIADNAITVGGGVYTVTSSTVIFDVYKVKDNSGDVKVLNYSAIKNKAVTDVAIAQFQVIPDGAAVKMLAVYYPNSAITPSDTALASTTKGVVLAQGIDGDGNTVTINENGTVKTYKMNSDALSAGFCDKQFADYRVNASGKIDLINSVGIYVYNGHDDNDLAAGQSRSYTGGVAVVGSIYRVTGIDTASNAIKVKAITDKDGDYMESDTAPYPAETYYRYDSNDIQVYDASDDSAPLTTIKGGLTVSNLGSGDYVWINSENPSTDKITVIVKLKKDNLKSW